MGEKRKQRENFHFVKKAKSQVSKQDAETENSERGERGRTEKADLGVFREKKSISAGESGKRLKCRTIVHLWLSANSIACF